MAYFMQLQQQQQLQQMRNERLYLKSNGPGFSTNLVGTGKPCLVRFAFNFIDSGTNTTAAMVVGSGASLGFTAPGTINASTLNGATFASPGSIGSTTPGTGRSPLLRDQA